MLAAAADRVIAAKIIRWVQALAEDLPVLGLGKFRLVTFGQSFHWTEREVVAEAVFEIVEVGGEVGLSSHAHGSGPQAAGTDFPPLPNAAIRVLIGGCLWRR